MADERTRYSDAELEEFKQLILKKLESARADYELLRATITHTADNLPSIKLHERLGFRFVGTLTEAGCKFGNYLDVIYFEMPV